MAYVRWWVCLCFLFHFSPFWRFLTAFFPINCYLSTASLPLPQSTKGTITCCHRLPLAKRRQQLWVCSFLFYFIFSHSQDNSPHFYSFKVYLFMVHCHPLLRIAHMRLQWWDCLVFIFLSPFTSFLTYLFFNSTSHLHSLKHLKFINI